jgi:hypothetical protein
VKYPKWTFPPLKPIVFQFKSPSLLLLALLTIQLVLSYTLVINLLNKVSEGLANALPRKSTHRKILTFVLTLQLLDFSLVPLELLQQLIR